MYTMEVSKTRAGVAVIGRVLLSIIFITSAFLKIMNWSATAAFMADKGLPAVPLLLNVALVVELLGGLALLTGVMARWGAFMLIAYLVPVTMIFHNMWSVSAEQMMTQTTDMLKNLAIMGGLFMVVAFGPGPFVVQEKSFRISEDQSHRSPGGWAGTI